MGEACIGSIQVKDPVKLGLISTYEFLVKKSPHMNVSVLLNLMNEVKTKGLIRRKKLD